MNKAENFCLHKGDCLEIMKAIPNGSVDLILCDLPYGNTNCKWDSIISFVPLWKQYNRIIKKNGAIVLFSTQPFTTELIHSNIKNYKHSWIWHKKNAGNMLVAKYQPLKTTEEICVFSSGGRVAYYPILSSGHKDRTKEKPCKKRTDLYSGIKSGYFAHGENKRGDQRYPKHLIEFSNASRNGKFHPTQKPVELLEYLIKTYSKEEDTVLDNCMGSGSTGVACANTGRKFIGIELDNTYFAKASERIADAFLHAEMVTAK